MENIVNEVAPAYQKLFYAIAEYPEMEKASAIKHAYFRGEIFAMAGAGNRHTVLFKNVFGQLYINLTGRPW